MTGRRGFLKTAAALATVATAGALVRPTIVKPTRKTGVGRGLEINYRREWGFQKPVARSREAREVRMRELWRRIKPFHDVGMRVVHSDPDSHSYQLKVMGRPVELVLSNSKLLRCVDCHSQTRNEIHRNVQKFAEREALAYAAFWGARPESFLPRRILVLPLSEVGENGGAMATTVPGRSTIYTSPLGLLLSRFGEGILAHEFAHVNTGMDALCHEVWAYHNNCRGRADSMLSNNGLPAIEALKNAVSSFHDSEIEKKLGSMVDEPVPVMLHFTRRYDELEKQVTASIRRLDATVKQARSEYEQHLVYWDTWARKMGSREIPFEVFVAKNFSQEKDIADGNRVKTAEVIDKVFEAYVGTGQAITRRQPEQTPVLINSSAGLKENVLENLKLYHFDRETALKAWYQALKRKFVAADGGINYANLDKNDLAQTNKMKFEALSKVIDEEREKLDQASKEAISKRMQELVIERLRIEREGYRP